MFGINTMNKRRYQYWVFTVNSFIITNLANQITVIHVEMYIPIELVTWLSIDTMNKRRYYRSLYSREFHNNRILKILKQLSCFTIKKLLEFCLI